MKKIALISTIALLCFVPSGNLQAQDSTKVSEKQKSEKKLFGKEKKKRMRHGRSFVDKDGDGYNDNAPDHDGDGIPNGLDADWKKRKKGRKKHKGSRLRFVDLDGDGIHDNLQAEKTRMQGKRCIGKSTHNQLQKRKGPKKVGQKGKK